MIPLERKMTPKPQYRGTVVCSACHAEYNPRAYWIKCRYSEGTSGNYRVVGKIAEGCCPICRTKREK